MQPFWRAMTFSSVLVRRCVCLMREASTLILQRALVSGVAFGADQFNIGPLRSNVVDDNSDPETMVAAEDVLEEGRLAAALQGGELALQPEGLGDGGGTSIRGILREESLEVPWVGFEASARPRCDGFYAPSFRR
jgi:hypothetical protein